MKKLLSLTLLSSALLASCNYVYTPDPPSGQMVYGLDKSGMLTSFGLGNPASSYRTMTITGLGAGETLVDLDFWNKDSALYALSSTGTLYRVNTTTGTLTKDSMGAMGTPAAMDFNPAAGRLRVVSTSDDNYRFTPATSALTADGKLAYSATDVKAGANPNLTAAAYTNSFSGFTPAATDTALYTIDADTDTLVMHTGGPQFSTLNTVGNLNVNAVAGGTGFDISGMNDAYLSITDGSSLTLYRVNLLTGATTPITSFAGSMTTFAVSLPSK